MAACFCFFTKAARADESSGEFSITSVEPASFSNEADQTITLTGSGFYSGLWVGLHYSINGVITDLSDLTDLKDVTIVSSEQATAVVPAGTRAGQYDIFMYQPDADPYYYMEAAVEIGSQTSTDTPELQFNGTKSARKKVNVTYRGLVMTKKKWVKARINGKNIPITKLRRSGNDTTITLNLKYKKWPMGSYALILSYKNRVKVKTEKNGKVRYRKTWEKGRVQSDNLFSIIQ